MIYIWGFSPVKRDWEQEMPRNKLQLQVWFLHNPSSEVRETSGLLNKFYFLFVLLYSNPAAPCDHLITGRHSHSWLWNRHYYCFSPFLLSFKGGMNFSPLPLSHYSGFSTASQVSRSLAAYSKTGRIKKDRIMKTGIRGIPEEQRLSKIHNFRTLGFAKCIWA